MAVVVRYANNETVVIPQSQAEIAAMSTPAVQGTKDDLVKFLQKTGPNMGADIFGVVGTVAIVAGIPFTGLAGGAIKGGATLGTKLVAGTAAKVATTPFIGNLAGSALTAAGSLAGGTAGGLAGTTVGMAGTGRLGTLFNGQSTVEKGQLNPEYAKPKGGLTGALAKGANQFARVGTAILDGERYNYNSIDPSDILSGFDDQYPPEMRQAAQALAWCNIRLSKDNKSQYEDGLKEQQPGTPANMYRKLIDCLINDSSTNEQALELLKQINADNTLKNGVLQYGRQKMGGGQMRIELDLGSN
jgi:hypothetical protein